MRQSSRQQEEKKLGTYKGILMRQTADFNKREQHKIFNMMKGENLQPRILNLERLSLRIEGEIKIFPDKQRLKEFITTKVAL